MTKKPKASKTKKPKKKDVQWQFPAAKDIHQATRNSYTEQTESAARPLVESHFGSDHPGKVKSDDQLQAIALEIPKIAKPLTSYIKSRELLKADINKENANQILFQGLHGFAIGNIPAIVRLFEFLQHYVDVFNHSASVWPELVRAFASKESLWPVLSNSNPKVKNEHVAFFSKIRLATDISVPGYTKSIGIVRTTAKRIAVELIHLIEMLKVTYQLVMAHGSGDLKSNRLLFDGNLIIAFRGQLIKNPKYTDELVLDCVSLPPLAYQDDVIEQWWSLAKKLLLVNTNKKPELNDELYRVGQYNEKHYSSMKKIEGTPFDWEADDGWAPLNNKGSVNANVRAAIMKRLRKEFDSIAFNLPKAKS